MEIRIQASSQGLFETLAHEFMSILCATDFSNLARSSADVAAWLAVKMKAPLRLIHCMHDYLVMGELPVVIPDEKPIRMQLNQEAERLRKKGAHVVEDFRHGEAAWEVIAAAKEHQVELIVLGSTGHGAGNWLLGSVAEQVAESSPVPALVLSHPQEIIEWLAKQKELEVLLGADLGHHSPSSITWIKRLAELGPLKVTAAHIHSAVDDSDDLESHQARERDVWDQVHAGLGELPVTVHVRETTGDPRRQFVNLVKEKNPGLVVLGCHQRHGWRRLGSSSFSRRVLAQAMTNALCIPLAEQVLPDSIPSIHRVLVAADLGESTAEQLRRAQGLLTGDGSLCLVHVCHEPERIVNPLNASEIYFDHSLATARERREAAEKIQNLPNILTHREGVHFQSEIFIDHDIAGTICTAAERFGADVICMGSKGHSRIANALLGSTVQAVLARTHLPVFVIPPPSA